MLFVTRDTPVPEILRGGIAREQRQRLHAFMSQDLERIGQSTLMQPKIDLNDSGLRDALRKQFHGKCAFCERRVDTQTYLFRPRERAVPSEDDTYSHLYYQWLEVAWQNYYPICFSCFPKNSAYFPVIGPRADLPKIATFERYARSDSPDEGLWPDYPLRERAVLLDPCVDNKIGSHLKANVSGELIGVSLRGSETVDHFRLNTRELIHARKQAYDLNFHALMNVLQRGWFGTDGSNIFDYRRLEFGGTWQLVLSELASLLNRTLALDDTVSADRLPQFFRKVAQLENNDAVVNAIWRQLHDSPLETERAEIQDAVLGQPELRHIGVRNFKSVERAEISLGAPKRSNNEESRTPCLMIIGENAVGKSSILEAIALAMLSDWDREALRLSPGKYVMNPRLFGKAGDQPDVIGEVVLNFSDKSAYMLSISKDVMQDQATRGGRPMAVFAYGAFRQYLEGAVDQSTPSRFVANLFKSSELLANPEPWLLSLTDSRFAMAVRALRHILSIDGEFEVIRRDRESETCSIVISTYADGGPKEVIPLELASSGYRSILAMACDVMKGLMEEHINPRFDSLENARGIVLIDEVEAHLHPRWKIRIMGGLRRALPGITFITTTHDPLCLRDMSEQEVLVLRRAKAAKGASRLRLPTFVEVKRPKIVLADYRLEQLLTSDLFDLYTTDDPEGEARLSKVSEWLEQPDRLNQEDRRVVEFFKQDIASALPVGNTEVHRLVQKAVAKYLQEKCGQTQRKIEGLEEAARREIVDILRGELQ